MPPYHIVSKATDTFTPCMCISFIIDACRNTKCGCFDWLSKECSKLYVISLAHYSWLILSTIYQRTCTYVKYFPLLQYLDQCSRTLHVGRLVLGLILYKFWDSSEQVAVVKTFCIVVLEILLTTYTVLCNIILVDPIVQIH